MTTIVYHKGVIAADGRITVGNEIASDSRCKMHKIGGAYYFFGGEDIVLDEIEANGGIDDLETCSDSWNAIIYRGGKVYLAGSDDGQIFMELIRDDDPTAIGSGAAYATAAIDMGATPRQAVEMAAKRDSATGGNIMEWQLDDLI